MIRREELTSKPAQALIAALNAELAGAYPEPGANHFGLDAGEIAPGRGAFLVVYREGRPVGCGAVRLLDAETAELKRMYVDPALRGAGLGRELVRALEAEARILGARRIVLETGTRQTAALALYARCGFKPIPLYGEYLDSPETSVCLGKSLDAATIRAATAADAATMAGIYNHYVRDTIVTFEEEVVSPSEMARRLEEVRSASLPWLVAALSGQVVGYAYASKWKGRCGYRFSTEITVYLDPAHGGKGIGSTLYGELLPSLRERGLHSVIGGIALPNPASVALHEKFGMEKVAHFKEVGFKFDRWIDVGYWQGTL